MCIGCENYPPELNELGKTIDGYFLPGILLFFLIWGLVFIIKLYWNKLKR